MVASTVIRKINLLTALLVAISIKAHCIYQEHDSLSPPQTIIELQTAIEKVLEETQTPAAGVALVNKEGPVWVAGLGTADIEKDMVADENTMFRIGSTSKMFVSLSILKLQEEGRLSLKDKVREFNTGNRI